MADPFAGKSKSIEAPADEWFSITLADSDLATIPRAIDCTTSGNVDIQSQGGTTVTITLTAGQPYPVRPIRVKNPSSGTAASGVIGLY